MKKLLIIMPLYNDALYVERAIDSIINQTFKNFKLYIINDCSTDNSLTKIEKYLKDDRIKIIHNKENMGAYYSRNVGLKILEKENFDIFTIHDSDDFSDSTRFEKAIEFFNDENLLGLEDLELRIGGMPPEWLVPLGKTMLNHAHAFFNKKVFDILGYFDNSKFGADTEYWKRLSQYVSLNKNYSIHSLHKLLYYAQITGKNLTLKHGEDVRDMYFKKHMKEIENMKDDKDFYRSFFEYN